MPWHIVITLFVSKRTLFLVCSHQQNGLNHYAMWGGSSPRHEEPYPADFESFLRVFFIRSASPSHPGSPPGWVNNKIGNHIASRNHGINFSRETYTLGVFLQDIIEDGSGWRRRNYPDGLWGIWFRLNDNQKPLHAVTYEYLQTTLQSGPEYMENGEVVGGRDNYFNHGVYQSGWSYYSYTIGTPLISSPILNDPSVFSFTNNRVRAHHLGLMGHLGQDVSYRALFTYSRNYGTYSKPFDKRKDQYSGMVELTTPTGFFDLEASIAITADLGDMYGNNIGLMLRLVRKGSFGK